MSQSKLEEIDLSESFFIEQIEALTGTRLVLYKNDKNMFELHKGEKPIFVTFVRGAISVFLAGYTLGLKEAQNER